MPRGGDEGVPRTPKFHRSPWWAPELNNHYEPITRANGRLEAFAARHRHWLRWVDCSHLFLARALQPADQLKDTTRGSVTTTSGDQLKDVAKPPKERSLEVAKAAKPKVSSSSSGGGYTSSGGGPQYIPPHLMYDLLHLTPDAYRLWAGCLQPEIQAALDAGGAGGAQDAPKRRDGASGAAARRVMSAPTPVECVGRSCRGAEVDLA